MSRAPAARPSTVPAGSADDQPTHGVAASRGLTSALTPRAIRDTASARPPVLTSPSSSTRRVPLRTARTSPALRADSDSAHSSTPASRPLLERRTAQAEFLTGRSFFPQLITQPFSDGLTAAFWFAIAACLVAAAASWFTGTRSGTAVDDDGPAMHKDGPAAHESVGAELAASAGELVRDR
jgi:hypothetical protein